MNVDSVMSEPLVSKLGTTEGPSRRDLLRIYENLTTEAIQLAADPGFTVVAGRCMGATHGELGVGPGPHSTVRPSDNLATDRGHQ